MDVLEAIFTRRSIREFTNEDVSEADLETLLRAAMAAPSGEGYSLVTRDDGTKQVAYKGKPLYYWSKDMKPGDKTGDGVNNLWRMATP